MTGFTVMQQSIRAVVGAEDTMILTVCLDI